MLHFLQCFLLSCSSFFSFFLIEALSFLISKGKFFAVLLLNTKNPKPHEKRVPLFSLMERILCFPQGILPRLRGITFIQEPSDQFFYRTSSFIQTLLLVPDFHRISRRNFAQLSSLQTYLLFRRTAVFYLRVADCQLLLSPPVGNLTLPRRNFLFTGGIILHLRLGFNLFFCQIIFF